MNRTEFDHMVEMNTTRHSDQLWDIKGDIFESQTWFALGKAAAQILMLEIGEVPKPTKCENFKDILKCSNQRNEGCHWKLGSGCFYSNSVETANFLQ